MRAGEPSGPIQLIGPGLLGLLQIKSPSGQNPNVLNADVQPGIDMLPFWLRANRQVWAPNSGTTLPAAVYNLFVAFGPNAITVPEREWWYVHSYNVTLQLNAGGTARSVRLAMAWNTVGTIKYRSLGDERIVSQTDVEGRAMISAYDFWVPPGAALGIYLNEVEVADLEVTVRGMDYTILPI